MAKVKLNEADTIKEARQMMSSIPPKDRPESLLAGIKAKGFKVKKAHQLSPQQVRVFALNQDGVEFELSLDKERSGWVVGMTRLSPIGKRKFSASLSMAKTPLLKTTVDQNYLRKIQPAADLKRAVAVLKKVTGWNLRVLDSTMTTAVIGGKNGAFKLRLTEKGWKPTRHLEAGVWEQEQASRQQAETEGEDSDVDTVAAGRRLRRGSLSLASIKEINAEAKAGMQKAKSAKGDGLYSIEKAILAVLPRGFQLQANGQKGDDFLYLVKNQYRDPFGTITVTKVGDKQFKVKAVKFTPLTLSRSINLDINALGRELFKIPPQGTAKDLVNAIKKVTSRWDATVHPATIKGENGSVKVSTRDGQMIFTLVLYPKEGWRVTNARSISAGRRLRCNTKKVSLAKIATPEDKQEAKAALKGITGATLMEVYRKIKAKGYKIEGGSQVAHGDERVQLRTPGGAMLTILMMQVKGAWQFGKVFGLSNERRGSVSLAGRLAEKGMKVQNLLRQIGNIEKDSPEAIVAAIKAKGFRVSIKQKSTGYWKVSVTIPNEGTVPVFIEETRSGWRTSHGHL